MALKEKRHLSYTVIFEPAEEGGYTIHVPALPGCISEAETLDEARKNAKEAIESYIGSLLKDGEPIPDDIRAEPVYEKVQVSLASS